MMALNCVDTLSNKYYFLYGNRVDIQAEAVQRWFGLTKFYSSQHVTIRISVRNLVIELEIMYTMYIYYISTLKI